SVYMILTSPVVDLLHLIRRPSPSTLFPYTTLFRSRDVAQEICVRTGSKAFLLGSISSLAGQYLVGVDAVSCSSGDTLTRYCPARDRKSTRLNSSHQIISYAVFCLKKKTENYIKT